MPFTLSTFLTKVMLPSLLFTASISNAAATVDSSSVGPSTPLSSKSTLCSILDYGGVADGTTDVGPSITKAFSSCVSGKAATLYIPEGSYSLATGVTLKGSSGWAFRIDGLITLTSDGDFNGNAFVIEDTSDLEIYSSNNLGAINGQGYIARKDSTGQNARLMRLISVSNVSLHNMIYIDSPTFHVVLNGVSNFELYYVTVRGPDLGGTDGIDIECTDNCYLHDFEVTNRDECVSVKSPSNNVLIEDAYCNQSGGMSIGSLTADVTSAADANTVSNITMRNIYIYQCTQMLMLKTFPGGDGATGYLKDSLFENFWAYDTTYALDIDQYWESTTTPDTGAVALSGLTFSNWTGSMDDGQERGAVVIRGSDVVPLQDITLEGFDMWTVNGKEVVNQCKNVYGTGMCIQAATGSATYTTSVTSTVAPSGYTAPASPTWGVAGYGTTDPIPVYTPAVWWPASSVVASTAASVTSVVGVESTSSASAASASTVVSPVETSTVASTSNVSSVVSTSSLVATTSTKAASSSSSSSVSKASKKTKSSSKPRGATATVSTVIATSYSTTFVAPSSGVPVASANSTKIACTGGRKPSSGLPSFSGNGTVVIPTGTVVASTGFVTSAITTTALSSAISGIPTSLASAASSIAASAGSGSSTSNADLMELIDYLMELITSLLGSDTSTK